MSEPTPPEDAPVIGTRGGEDLLAEVTDDFLRRHRAGERPSIEEYAGRHPELAARIRDLFPALLAIEQAGVSTTLDFAPASERVGATIGRYKLLERIGEGGFGVVYMAEQLAPVRRRVAVKVIRPGCDTRQVIARFEAERQALALMEHENIAKVLDAGATESGLPYFVMELVHGVPITDYCDRNQLTSRERLELFVQVCRAVQHAHTKGIIHRDIKPTNVLVTLHEGVAVPKVIDFGVAKATGQQLTEKTLFTNFAQMVGTPLYMSPEQAEMTGVDVDTRSDVYSLGVLLYELLTGTTPLDKERLKQSAFDEIRRIIREEEPPRPSTRLSTLGDEAKTISARRKSDPGQLGRLIRGELDWIVMKSLEKDRRRRYETANGFGRDVERYLRDEAVEACPPSAAYRFNKLARRNRRALTMGAIVLGVLLAGTIVSTWQAIRATRATHAEREMRQQAKESEAAAKESERVAVDNAKKAQQQSTRADAYFLGARSNVDRMAERLNDPKLLQIPEIRNIRIQLLNDLLNFYQAIVNENVVDVAAAQEKAGALRMIGDIQQILGDRAAAEKAYHEAIAIREPYVAAHPEDQLSYQVLATCHANLGELMEEMNRPAEAEADYRRALVLWAPLATDLEHKNPVYLSSLAKFHKRLFDLLEYGGQGAAARAVCGQLLAPFEDAAAKAPDNVGLQRRLADALYWADGLMMATGREEEGRRLGDRALGLYEKFPDTIAPSGTVREMVFRYVRKADLLENRQRFAEAELAYRKIVELDPEGPPYYELGKFLLDQKKEGEAIAVYKKAVVAVPSYNFLRMELAWLLANCSDVKFRDPVEAVAVAKKAVELGPTDERSSKVLGTALYRTGDWKAASAALQKFMEAYGGGDSATWFFLAMAKWQLGEKAVAREWYGRAVESLQKNEPDHFVIFQNKAELNRFRREAATLLGVNEAQSQHASAVPFPATNPAASGANNRLNIPKALWGVEDCREELRLHPGDSIARGSLARALKIQAHALLVDSDPAKRDPPRALKLAREAVELSPYVADYWNILGVAEYRDGNWKNAIVALQKCREVRPYADEWWNPFFLAMAHWQLGDKDEARSWYDKGARWIETATFSYRDEPLLRTHLEAAELLGMNDPQKRHASSRPSPTTNPTESGVNVNARLNVPDPTAQQADAGELRHIQRIASVHTPSSLPATRPDGPVIRAYDVPALQKHLGRSVTVEGRVRGVSFTTAHNALNIELAGPEARALLVWIPPDSYVKFAKEFGEDPTALLMNRSIRVSGRLSEYGGRRAGWKDRLQITLDDPSQLSILATDTALPTTQK